MFQKENYSKKGRKNKTINQKFIEICKLTKTDLKKYLDKELKKYYKNVIAQDGFLYAKGKDKVCVTAHMDTVHKEPIKTFYEYKKGKHHIISSPQGIGGDDRCGVYMILKLLENGLRPTILFCEDEEIGCVGSEKFVGTKFIKDLEKMYFLIELDRRGGDNIVFYEDANEEWHNFVEDITGLYEETGSFTDICTLSPACGISSVNIGCGYYNAHTLDEYVILEEMENSIKKTEKLIKEGLKRKEKFEYKEEIRERWSNYDRYDWYEDYSYGKNKTIYAYIKYDNGYGNKGEVEYEGNSMEEAFYNFFIDHPEISFSQIVDYDVYDDSFLPVTKYLSAI